MAACTIAQKPTEDSVDEVVVVPPKMFAQFVQESGYVHESYTVTTKDGYVSEMFRIPGKVQDIGQETKKPAVLMLAGWLADHKFWMANTADLAPPFTLVDAGYDVWLGNNRGDRYAQAHEILKIDKQEFWEFNWIDMGVKDTPEFIDFVLERTGQSQLTYVGHSRGTAQVFAGASLMPDYYAEKVNLMVALGPVANVNHIANKSTHYQS
jgi:pimeloyl-ACP methyl ester carboxylesterase